MVSRHDEAAEDRWRLFRFHELNPHLFPGQGSHRCRGLWDLLTSGHREDPECCVHGGQVPGLERCFLDRMERWKDSKSGLPVLVAHPACRHGAGDDHHGPFRDFFASRGLDCLVSRGSWHADRPSLVVVARADVAEGIRMPAGEMGMEPVHRPRWPMPDWEMAEALRLAEEQVLRNRKARLALDADGAGDRDAALALHCEVAYMDRTGGFHNLAREQLEHARRIAEGLSGLELGRLYFKNARDRNFVCGAVPRVLSRAELNRRLGAVQLPRGWWRFRSTQPGHVVSRVSETDPSGEERSATVSLEQGGAMNYWGVLVEYDDGATMRPSLHGETHGYSDSPIFCWPDPESAVRAVIEAWRIGD